MACSAPARAASDNPAKAAVRTTEISMASRTKRARFIAASEIRVTKLPRWGQTSISPSSASRIRASRTGARLVPK
jgi:hypothetical protein